MCSRRSSYVLVVAVLAASCPALAAEEADIADNSFLIEEAYNQEAGVVQHIQTFARATDGWAYSFTDEWPLDGERDELSLTVALAGHRSAWGLGDASLSYRRELYHSAGGGAVVTPRLSVSAPTGDAGRGFGSGLPGLAAELCVSLRPFPWLALHENVGTALPLSSRDAAAGASVNAGQSVIWLMQRQANLLVEVLWTHPTRAGGRTESDELLVSPGLRAAFDVADGVQLVPGVAVPIGLGTSRGDRRLFLYLSIEHALPAAVI